MSAKHSRLWLVIFVIVLPVITCSAGLCLHEYPTVLQCPDCPTLRVSRVIDGDTFDSARGRVRLFRVDTPERGER